MSYILFGILMALLATSLVVIIHDRAVKAKEQALKGVSVYGRMVQEFGDPADYISATLPEFVWPTKDSK